MTVTRDARQRFLIESAGVRGEIVTLSTSLESATARTDYPPSVRRLLDEAFVAANLLTGTLKFDGRLTLQVRGDGSIPLLVVQANSDDTFRGLARWRDAPAESASLMDAFGDQARMTITIEAGERAEPYQGIVMLEGSTLADAIARYFRDSEQLATTLHVAQSSGNVTGLLLQRLPADAASERAARADATDGEEGWRRCAALVATLTDEELARLPAEDLLHRLFHEEQVRLFDNEPLGFHCSCSRARTDGMLLGLGRSEVDDIIAERGDVEITCEFCDAQYRYDAVDVQALFRAGASATDTGADPTRH